MRSVDAAARGVIEMRTGARLSVVLSRGWAFPSVLLGAILLLFASMLSPAASAQTAEANFAARCRNATPDGMHASADGVVLRCFGFDNAAQLPSHVPGAEENWGYDFGINANNHILNVPTIDCSQATSGGCSMRFHIPTNAGTSAAGSWFTHFGVNKTGQIGPGGRIFVQFRVRWSPEILQTSLWPGGGGAKLMDISLGDPPICDPAHPSSVTCPTSCPAQNFEFVLQDNGQIGAPSVYANCGGGSGTGFHMMGSPVGDGYTNGQNMIAGCSSRNGAAPCKRFVSNQWMTFKIMLVLNQWNAWSNPVKVWYGVAGSPLTLIIDCESGVSPSCTSDFAQGANGWYFDNSDPATYKMGKVYLHPYRTCENSSVCGSGYGNNATADVWYDELIISTQDIPDPDVPSSNVSPKAPCCLSLTYLGPMSFVVLGVILLGRRGWYRRPPIGEDPAIPRGDNRAVRPQGMPGGA
jgi:hypothetical protein